MAFLLYGCATTAALPGLFPNSTTCFLSSHPSKPTNPSFRTTRSLTFSPLRVAAPPTQPVTSDQSNEEREDEVVAVDDERSSSSSKFLWRDHWYPVSLIEDLDTNRPTPFQLLGRDIVLWKDKSTAEWVAFDDKCPHRLAPLSVIFFNWSFALFCFPGNGGKKI